ncbi:hypothetical protein BKA70DRAFT_1280314 [Coprinopsis sp. MPI-PUGE-AT-0042]|nr:hypothetical protein BKA70DRAFT_1280314 [Coprinopsis sp. MPI-PUGE-AT-0042]
MSYLSSRVHRFADSVHPGYEPGFYVLDDIIAVIIFAGFSGIQAQLFNRLRGYLRNGDFKSPSRAAFWFGIVHIVLGAGYIFCAILAIVNFIMKLGLVTQHTIFVGIHQPYLCPSGYSRYYLPLPFGVCLHNEWYPLYRTTEVVDGLLRALFQLIVLLSDGLLLFRCCILFEQPWVNAAMGASALRLGWFLAAMFAKLPGHASSIATTYVSLSITLASSAALIVWILQQKMKAKSSVDRTQVLYTESIVTIVKAALPQIILGFVHISILAGFHFVSVGLNALWISLTALASQRITVSVFEQGDQGILNGKVDQEISLPTTSE